MTKGKSKHKRRNRERWDKAWNLVQFWYAEQAREGAIRFTVSGEEVSIAVPVDAVERDTLAQARKDRPQNWCTRRKCGVETVTADGHERRYAFPQGADDFVFPSASATRTYVAPHIFQGRPRIEYAREVMRAVAGVSLDAHKALEMRAATWDFLAVADKIGCGEPMARQYFAEGMGVVMTYQALVPVARCT